MTLNAAQRAQLLRPLNAGRVAKRQGLSYLEAYDVKAHLTRIFGFGGFAADVLDSQLVFDDTSLNSKGKENHDVAYKVVLRLTIFGIGPNGEDATFTEAAIGASHQPDRAEAHDMAVKTAESDALKRAATYLGTQFGLSLYDDGSTRDIIGRTLDQEVAPQDDTQREVKKDQSLNTGVETDAPDSPQEPTDAPQESSTPVEAPAGPSEPHNQQTQPPEDNPEAADWVAALKQAVEARSVKDVMTIKAEIAKDRKGRLVYQGVTLAKWCDKAIVAAGKPA